MDQGKVEIKIYSFLNGNGEDFIAATHAREAIKYYFDNYMDDLNIGDMVEKDGILIRELTNEEVRKPLEETTNLDDSTKEYSLFDVLKDVLKQEKHLIPTWIYKREY